MIAAEKPDTEAARIEQELLAASVRSDLFLRKLELERRDRALAAKAPETTKRP